MATRPFFVATLFAAAIAPVHADVGGSLAVQSDTRWRGLSYSDGKPQAQASVAVDHADSGLYGGALLTRVSFDYDRDSTAAQLYAGRVFRLQPGLDTEFGAQYTHFAALTRYDYGEVFAGLLGEAWNTRLYLSNDYFGSGQRSAYVELNLQQPLPWGLSGQAHVGWLRGIGRARWPNPDGDSRPDWRIGVARRMGVFEAQLGWVGATRGGPYTWVSAAHREALVLGLSASF
ncbi:MAG: hypothetical protein JO006_15820 [Paucibacter sp.]|nr:hypothetical protein [Roseateles sp.]